MKRLILLTLTLLVFPGPGPVAWPATEPTASHREGAGGHSAPGGPVVPAAADKLNPMIHKLPSGHGHGEDQAPVPPREKVSFYDESITADLPPIAAGATATSDIITITGVKQGDFCIVSSSGLLPTGIALTCRTRFEGVVVYLHNVSNTPQDPPGQTYFIRIFRR